MGSATSPDRWSKDFAAFIVRCEDARNDADVGGIVLDFARLLEILPPAALAALGERNSFDAVEGQIAVGAYESAAISVAGSAIGWLVSRSPGGVAMASAWIPDHSGEHTLKSVDPAVALCGAIALACREMTALRGTPLRQSAIN